MLDENNESVSFWESLLSDFEKLVVAGEHERCRLQLDSLSQREISRELAPRFAQLANRVHHPVFAMKLLYQFVFPDNSFARPASVQEKSVYAYSLLNLGASKEALDLLESIDATFDPEVFLQRAFAHFKNWDYLKSLPSLDAFIASENLSPYRKLVGQVNLAAAYISLGRWSAADQLLQFIEQQCIAGDFYLLLGNCYELQAQAHFFQKKYHLALSCLEKGIEILKNQKGLYLIFVEKWMIICRCFLEPTENHLDQLRLTREKAYQENYWETARECDLFEGILTHDETLIRKVLMGTPSDHYCQRARELFGPKAFRRSGEYSLLLQGARQGLVTRSFNPYNAGSKGERLSEKKYLLALFEALTLDFYKPSYLGSLFKIIYPDEKFNPNTSPQRVLQLLKRLNQWFKNHNWPIYVQFKKSEFALKAHESISITIYRGRRVTHLSQTTADVRKIFRGRTFTAAQFSRAMGFSKSSGYQMMQKLLAQGKVISVGKGRGTSYQFTQSKNLKVAV